MQGLPACGTAIWKSPYFQRIPRYVLTGGGRRSYLAPRSIPKGTLPPERWSLQRKQATELLKIFSKGKNMNHRLQFWQTSVYNIRTMQKTSLVRRFIEFINFNISKIILLYFCFKICKLIILLKICKICTNT